jgi:phage/plasmid-like protein (TIGR03299 family)
MPDEVVTMFSTFTPAWHGLGKVLDNPATATEAIIEAGLDWEVRLHPINVGGIPIEDKYATVRDDTGQVLGVVGKRYRPIQNKQLFGFFDPVVDQTERIYHTAGVLRDSKIVWLLAKLDQSFYVVDDDRVDQYILLCSSHDGSLHVTVKSTPVRVVCMNTLNAALLGNTSSMLRIKHTLSADYEIRAAHRFMGLASKSMDTLREIADSLLRRQLSTSFMKKFVEVVFPSKRNVEKRPDNRHYGPVIEMLEHESNQLPGMEYTGWAAFNALTAHLDHTWGSDDTRLYRTWLGEGEDVRAKAIKFLIKQLEE